MRGAATQARGVKNTYQIRHLSTYNTEGKPARASSLTDEQVTLVVSTRQNPTPPGKRNRPPIRPRSLSE
jgi:hypothetical protein